MADDPRDEPGDPAEELRELLRGMLGGAGGLDPDKLAALPGFPGDPQIVRSLLAQLQNALSYAGDGIDWSIAEQQAAALAARGAVPSTPAERNAFEQALHVAALWLDEATDIAALTTEPALLTRSGWAESTMPVWIQLAEPVATSISDALARVLEEHGPEDAGLLGGDPAKLVRNIGGALFAMQLGQVVGQLAGEVVSGGDVGIPLVDGEQRQAVLVPQNVDAFGAGLDIPVEELRLYLSVRELAHARLFRQAKWLRLQLITQVTDFARGIRIDTDRIAELASDFDPSNPEALRSAVTSGALIPPKTEEQLAALARLETQLALVEGWVDVVTAQATAWLPKSSAIAEAVRRRRAVGGPAESAFASLVGLELRPRRLREAAAMWQAVSDAVGANGRDALWDHPDVLPTAEDIDNPAALVARLAAAETPQDAVDRAIQDLIEGTGRNGEIDDNGVDWPLEP